MTVADTAPPEFTANSSMLSTTKLISANNPF